VKSRKGKVLCIRPGKKLHKHQWVKEEIARNPEMLKALGLELTEPLKINT